MMKLIAALCLALSLHAGDEPIHRYLNSLELGTAIEYKT